jgi:hypothetical protein
VPRSPVPTGLSPHSVRLVTHLHSLTPDARPGHKRRTVASVQPRRDKTGTRITSWRLHFRVNGRPQALSFDSEQHAEKWAHIFNTLGVADGRALLNAKHLSMQDQETADGELAEAPVDPPVAPQPAELITVRDVVEAAIDAKTGHAGEGYIHDGRAQAQWHIYDVVVVVKDPKNPKDPGYTINLGDLPIEQSTARWPVPTSMPSPRPSARVEGRWARACSDQNDQGSAHSLLSNAIMYAVEEMEIIPTNYCRGIKLSPARRRRHIYLTDDLQRRIIEGMDPAYRDFVIVLLGTGLRFGEVTALRRYSIVTTDYGSEIHVDAAWKNVRRGRRPPAGRRPSKGRGPHHVGWRVPGAAR